MSTLYVELLGSPRFSVDSRKISFARRRSKALLSYLICTERRATREELADLFWPDSNASRAMGSLRTILSEIHTCLHGAFLHSDGDVLYLDTTHISCDLLIFRNILESGPDLSDMREAAGLWKGGFLKGFTISSSPGFSAWQIQEEQNVFYEYKQLLRSLYEAEIKQGDYLSALNHARKYLHLDTFDEEGHRAVIYIHALRGERKLALQQYDTCRTIMWDEFESEVEDETRALVQRIKNGEIRKDGISIMDNTHAPRLAILPLYRVDIENHEVLLFLNMVMEALEDYFAVVPHLRIISRTSTLAYKDSGKRLSLIAAELQADYIIEGFCRGDETSLMIEARLLQTKPDEVTAIKTITLSPHTDNPAVAARYIGDAINMHFSPNATIETPKAGKVVQQQSNVHVSMFSNKLKLQAKHLLRIDEEGVCLKAVALFREAVRIDPSDAEAWAGIGSALLAYSDKGICFPNRTDKLQEAEKVARKALEIDEEEPTALTILGTIAVQKDWDFDRAEELFQKSLQLRPNNTRTLRDYAELCIMTGRYEEARRLSEYVNALDPVNHHNFKIRFWLHLVFHEFQMAEDVVRQHFLLYPDPPLDQILHAHIHLIRGNIDAAMRCFEDIDPTKEMPLSWNHALLVGMGYSLAKKGRTSEAFAIIEQLQQNKSGTVYPYIPIAQIFIGLGEYDSALDWVEIAVEAHDPGLFFLAVNPLFFPLNNHARMEKIVKKTKIVLVMNSKLS